MGGADGRVVIDMQLKDQQAQKGVKGMKGGLLGLAKVVAAAFATKQLVNFGKQLAMNANEIRMIERQFDTTFGNASGVATANIDRIADSIGMLPGRVKPVFTKFSQSWLMAGKSMEKSMSLSESMLKISADAAAAFGMSFDDASGALQSFMKGNTQAGLALRINTSQVEIQQWALENLGLEWENLDEAQRKVARMDFVKYMYENGNITGFAAQASRDYYNVLGNLQQAWKELQAILGAPILDWIIDGMLWLTDIILRAIDFIPKLVQGFENMRKSAQRFEPVIEKVVAGIAAMIVIKKVATWIKALRAAMIVASVASKKVANAKLFAATANMRLMLSTKGLTAVQMKNVVAIKGSTLAIGVLTGKIKLGQAAQALMNTTMAKYPAILKLATAAKKAFTSAMVAGKGTALKFAAAVGFKKKVLVAGKAIVGLAKVALIAFKAVKLLLLGPIGWIIAGVTALTAGFVALIRWFRRTSDESKQLKQDMESLKESIEDKNAALDKSESAYRDSLSAIRANASANRTLANTVSNLASEEGKSAAQRAVLNGQLDQLSEALGGIVLYYDRETGALNMSNEELQKRINLLEAQESKNAGLERQSQLLREKHEVEMKKAETNELLRRAVELYGENSDRAEELTEVLNNLESTYEDLEVRLEVTSQAVYDHAAAVAYMTEVLCNEIDHLAQAVEDGTWSQIVSWEELTEAQQSAVDRVAATYDFLESTARNALNKVVEEIDGAMTRSIEILENNIEYTARWGENMATLYERAGQAAAPEGFIPWIEQMEGQIPGILHDVANGCDEEFARMVELFEQGGETASQATESALGEGFSEILDMVGRFGDDAGDSLRASIEAADFPGIGQGIPEGIAGGMGETMQAAEAASEQLAEAVEQGVRGPLGSNSPSTVMIDIGEGIPEGLGMGVTGNADAAVSPMSEVADMMVSSLEDGLSALDSISISSFANLASSARVGMSGVLSAIRSKSTQAGSALNTGLSTMRSSMQSNMQSIQSTASSGMSQMRSAITQGVSQSNQAMTTGLTQMNNTTRTNMTTMQTTTSTSMTKMNTTTRTNLTTMQNNARTAMTAFAQSFTTGMNTARSNVTSGLSSIVSALSGLSTSFHQAGVNAGNSLAAGIAASRGAAVAAARATANAVSAEMRNAMQIASPSRIMLAIGRFVGEGFARGIEDKIERVKRVTDILAQNALPQVKAESLVGLGRGTSGSALSKVIAGVSNVNHSYDNRGIFDGATIIWNNAKDIRETMEEMMFITQTEEARLYNV